MVEKSDYLLEIVRVPIWRILKNLEVFFEYCFYNSPSSSETALRLVQKELPFLGYSFGILSISLNLSVSVSL